MLSILEKIIACTNDLIVYLATTKMKKKKGRLGVVHMSIDYVAGGMSGQPDTLPVWLVWTVGGGNVKLLSAEALT